MNRIVSAGGHLAIWDRQVVLRNTEAVRMVRTRATTQWSVPPS